MKRRELKNFLTSRNVAVMDERTLQAGGPDARRLADPARRRLVAGVCLGLVATLAGCGGSDFVDPAATWDVVPSRSLTLPPGATFNLATTLPADVKSGGVFEVDPSGAPLPAGFSLTPGGLLFVSSSATGGTAGVVFRYTPPA
jgi:hypothetical protein